MPAPPELAADAAPVALAWASVAADINVTRLSYDPTVLGARQLTAARLQLDQQRLAAPPGDNVFDSLQSAQKLAADPLALAKLGDEAMIAVSKSLTDGIKANRDDAVRATYLRAQLFASSVGKLNSPLWKSLRAKLIAPLIARLESASQRKDGPAIEKAKALAQSIDVAPTLLEPAWSLAVLPVVKPVAVVRNIGVGMASLTPGVTVMRNKVTRAEYTQFANATQRPASRCRNRLALIAFKKRAWSDPGFTQTDSHPVVCISHDDATAYAQWLSQRTGSSYRLPNAAEWRLIAGYHGNADACQDGRLDCGQADGTVPASQGPASPLGLNGAHGNTREWLEDCAAGCNRRQVAGLGWRDSALHADAIRISPFDAHAGFDDIGFRLVRVDGGKP